LEVITTPKSEPVKQDIPEVEHIVAQVYENSAGGIDISISFFDDSGRTPSEGNFVKVPGTAYVKIICNSCPEVIYRGSMDFTEESFRWETLRFSEHLVVTYSLNPSEMKKGTSNTGEVWITFDPKEGSTFDTVKVKTDLIPKYTEIELAVNDYSQTAVTTLGWGTSYSEDSINFQIMKLGKIVIDGSDYLALDFDIRNNGRATFTYDPQNVSLEDCHSTSGNSLRCSDIVISPYIKSALYKEEIPGSKWHYDEMLFITPIGKSIDGVVEQLKDGGRLSFELYHDGTQREHNVVVYWYGTR
jgi:hypothetical protein